MQTLESSTPFGFEKMSVLRQSRFWTAQLSGWLLILPIYFRESIDVGIRGGFAPIAFVATAIAYGMAIACSTALAAAYLAMPARWLTGVGAVPIALGLSLLVALPLAGAMTLFVGGAMSLPLKFRQVYPTFALFHTSILMIAWSCVFLWLTRGDRAAARTEPRVLRADASSPEAKPSNTTHADPAVTRTQDATCATECVSVRWEPDAQVRLRDGMSETFCHVQDIAFIRAADNYTEVHLSNGRVALVKEPLRHWELRLPESFVRIHRSTLVNLDLSEELVHLDGAWHVRVRGCSESLSVSRRLVRVLKAKLDGRPGRLSMK